LFFNCVKKSDTLEHALSDKVIKRISSIEAAALSLTS